MSFFVKRVTGDEASFGQDLQDLRRVRGLSEEELSKLSGIHPVIIRLFEEEKLQDFQDPHYAERLVRVLATALDVRPDFLLIKYRKTLASHGIERGYAATLRPTPRTRDFFVTSRLWIGAGILSIVLALSGYVAWQVRQLSAPPLLALTQPTEGYTTYAPRVEVKGVTDPSVFVSVNGQKVVVNSEGSFATTVDIPSGVTTIHVEAKRRYGQTTVIERRILFQRQQSAFLK